MSQRKTNNYLKFVNTVSFSDLPPSRQWDGALKPSKQTNLLRVNRPQLPRRQLRYNRLVKSSRNLPPRHHRNISLPLPPSSSLPLPPPLLLRLHLPRRRKTSHLSPSSSNRALHRKSNSNPQGSRAYRIHLCCPNIRIGVPGVGVGVGGF